MSDFVATVTQRSPYVTEVQVRDHTIRVDRPEARGGTNEGASAREFLLVSLGSCFMRNLQAAVKAREANVSDIHVTVTGHADKTRYASIDLHVSATYTDRAQMEKLLVIAERGCFVSNTLRGAVAINVALS